MKPEGSGKLISGEVFLHKVNFFHLEGPAVQILQRACIRGKPEGQPVGVEGLIIPVKALVELAVFAVTQQGMTGVGELGADLMGPACDQLALHQAQTLAGGKGPVVGLAGLGAGLGGIRHKDPVLFGILKEIAF